MNGAARGGDWPIPCALHWHERRGARRWLTNPMRASLTWTARREAVTDQSHARFTDLNGAARGGDWPIPCALHWPERRGARRWLTNPMRASMTWTARREAVTDQSHARFTNMNGAARGGDWPIPCALHWPERRGARRWLTNPMRASLTWMALRKQVAGNYIQRQTRHARCKVQGNLYVIFSSTSKNARPQDGIYTPSNLVDVMYNCYVCFLL